jgi:SAM-dependent methyltransferase
VLAIRERLRAGYARQLRHPRGLAGRWVGRRLNRANAANLTAAVDALRLAPGQTALDVGFGGGLSLDMLLDKVGPDGHVHGVDVSRSMVGRAARRHRGAVRAGRLELHEAPMDRLPLPDSAMDGAMTVNTIYFVSDVDAAFAELARVVTPGGRLVVGLAHPEAMTGKPMVRHGFRVRTLAEVEAALRGAGLALAEDHRIGAGPSAYHLLVVVKQTPASE